MDSYFLLVVLAVHGAFAVTNPGFKARISQKGLSYANQVAVDALASDIKKVKIPDASGKSGRVSYTVYGMTIQSFSKPSSSMVLVPNRGFKWTANNAGISLKGKVKYKYKCGWIKISDHLRFDGSVSGVSFNMIISLGKDTSGRPSISGSNCRCSIGSFRIKFHGGASWLYNLFRKPIENAAKKALQKNLCTIAVNAVNKDAEKRMTQIPVTVPVAKKFLLDYKLTTPPVFTNKYMETFHKGEVYWKGDKKEAPFSPKPLPASSESSRMLYLWVSEYMANSFGYTALQHGYLKYNLTAADLPPGNRSVLNTTCKLVCVGKLIPQIAQKYPNSQVKMNMYATKRPHLEIHPGNIGLNFAGNVEMYAVQGGGKEPFLLTMNVTLDVKLDASISGELITGKIKDMSLHVGIVKSAVGKVDAKVLTSVMNFAVSLFVKPLLNKQGAKGLVLPVTNNIRFKNAQLEILENSILVATDVSYQPKKFTESNAVKSAQEETRPLTMDGLGYLGEIHPVHGQDQPEDHNELVEGIRLKDPKRVFKVVNNATEPTLCNSTDELHKGNMSSLACNMHVMSIVIFLIPLAVTGSCQS